MTDLLSLFKHWSNLETMMSCWWAGDDKEKYGYYTPSGLKASIHQPQRQIEKKLHMQKHFTHKMNFSKEFFFKNWIFQWSGRPAMFWHETTNFLQIFQTCNLQFSQLLVIWVQFIGLLHCRISLRQILDFLFALYYLRSS